MAHPESEFDLFRGAGLDIDETNALCLAGTLASALLTLPELHPSEKSEYVLAIHAIQDKLFARPAYRRYLKLRAFEDEREQRRRANASP